MDRRRILLVAAVFVAALGAALVFVFVRSAETRAEEKFDTVDVLVATQQIEAGETYAAAQAAGKVDTRAIAQDQLLAGVADSGAALQDQVALTTIFPNEQLIASKFGGATDVQSTATLPIPEGKVAISVTLTDPARVAGFVNPGSDVAIFFSSTAKFVPVAEVPDTDFTKALLSPVTVLAVGSTTQVTTTTTDETGAQTTEQLPRTLLTLALDQKEAEAVIFAQGHGELAFALLAGDSQIELNDGTTAGDLFKNSGN